MEEKYFRVSYYLSNGEKRIVSDVLAEDAEDALLKAPELISNDNIELNIKSGYHRISINHIIEMVAKEIPSPDKRKENRDNALDAFGKMRY